MSKHSIRIGGASRPSACCSPSSASTRLWRRRSARRCSWSSARRALRSASSRMRRFSPRSAARSSTGPPRRAASASASAARSRELPLHDDQRRDRDVPAVVLEHELLGHLRERRARPRWRGRRTGGRRAPRRAPGRPARWPRVPSSATATASSVPTDSLATRWRSSSERTARRRLRSSVACSNSCAAAAARMRASRSRSIARKRPERKSITPSMLRAVLLLARRSRRRAPRSA